MPAIIEKPAPAVDGHAIVLQSEDLPSLAAGILFAQNEIDDIGRQAMRRALPLKLQQGLCCLKARHLFGISDPAERGAMGGRPKTSSDSDQVDPETSSDSDQLSDTPASFADWIATQPLPKATAYDYMKAVEGLRLDHTATPQQVLAAYQSAAEKADGDLSIAKLKHLAPPAEDAAPEEPAADPNTPEVRAAEARELVHHWITTWDRSVKIGNLEHADTDTLRKLDEFLVTTRDHIRRRLKSAGA